MKLAYKNFKVEATTPRGCYDALIQAMLKADPSLVLKQSDCREIKADVLKQLNAKDWHPAPVVVEKPAKEGLLAKVKKAIKG